MTSRQVKRQESDKRILDATIEIIGQKGYGNANLREIAKAADVTQGLISQRFGTKENLLVQAIYSTHAVWVNYDISPEMPVQELLAKIISFAKKLYQRDEVMFRFIYTISTSVDIPVGIVEKQKDYFLESGLYTVMKKAQEKGYLPEGDIAALYNIFICNTLRLIRDYYRLGIKMPEDKYFMAAIQYRDLEAEEQEFLRGKAFDSVSQSFRSLIYMNLTNRSYKIIRTYSAIENYAKDIADAQELLNKACIELIDQSSVKAVLEFADLDIVAKRLVDEKVIAIQFTAANGKKYRLSFISVIQEPGRQIVLCGIRKEGNSSK